MLYQEVGMEWNMKVAVFLQSLGFAYLLFQIAWQKLIQGWMHIEYQQ